MKKILLLVFLSLICISVLFAMMPDKSQNKIVIEATGYGQTYDIARLQALYELALKLYDPFVSSSEDYTKRITIADDLSGVSESEYQDYIHHITVYQEGWIFSPEYEAEYVYQNGQKLVKVTAWVGDSGVPTIWMLTWTLSNDLGGLHSCIKYELPVCRRNRYSRDRVRAWLDQEKLVLLKFKANLSLLIKFQAGDLNLLLEQYEKLAEMYYKDKMSFIEYENLD